MPDQPVGSRHARTLLLPRRQLFLFLLVICLPCALLLFLGARAVMQEGELAQKRIADRRQQLADAVARALVDRLERIKLEEATAFAAYRDGDANERLARASTVFVAPVDSGVVRMGWTTDPYAIRAVGALAASQFASLIARGDHAALVPASHDTAAAAYRAALGAATSAPQVAFAELLLGRVLGSARSPLARASYERVLRMPSTVRDEQGIPFALYAAKALMPDTAARRSVGGAVGRIRAELLRSRALSLPACHALADLAVDTTVRERCADLERARIVASEASIPSISAGGDARWVTSDSGRWLLAVAPATSARPPILIAVRVDSLADAVADLAGTDLRLVASTDESVQPIGHGLEGLGVRWLSRDLATGWRAMLTSRLYVMSLVIVLAIVLLGGYVLWRDVRRELHLAHLRSQFVASVSHELRTPLTSIRIFAETLRDRPGMDPRKHHEYLETIARESDRLTRLMQNVLDFSRVERGERRYQRSPQRLAAIIESVLRVLRFPLEEQGFTVVYSCDEDAVVSCDADATEQAILNLVSNAIKYSGASRRLDVRMEHRGDTVAVVVRDYGIGIAPEHQPRLFERFYRAPTPDNEIIPGTGLGLTLAHHVAAGHDGQVTVESIVGEGSTFTLTLPLVGPSVATDLRRAPVAEPLALPS